MSVQREGGFRNEMKKEGNLIKGKEEQFDQQECAMWQNKAF